MSFDLIASASRMTGDGPKNLTVDALRRDSSNWRRYLQPLAAIVATALIPHSATGQTLFSWDAPAAEQTPAILQLASSRSAATKILAYTEDARSWMATTASPLAQHINVRRGLELALSAWTQAPLSGPRAAERSRRRMTIARFYAARGHEPLWRSGPRFSEAAVAVLQILQEADKDALDLRAAQLPDEGGWTRLQDELDLSEAVAEYAAQAAGERVDPSKVSRLIGMRPALPDAAQVLMSVSGAGSKAGEILQAFNPPHKGYRALREKLAELRAARVSGAHVLGTRVADAGISATDTIRGHNLASYPAPNLRAVEAEIIANMERWRWLPRDLGEDRVEVNIPQFELALKRHGATAHRMRVVVGKSTTPTPLFSDRMRFVVINPSWSVPASIIRKEMAGPHGGDLSYLANRGFQVSYHNGRPTVRQPPGEHNALGRVKFVFPNQYSVYLHDTPSRGLFGQNRRAFSHGCVRVDQPFKLAAAVLGTTSDWTEKRLRQLISNSERRIDLAEPLPVHIEYFTAYVDDYGELQMRDDIYGYSAKVRAALNLNEI
jgi:murein L,D-transpeptidase YcbB/YkuD